MARDLKFHIRSLSRFIYYVTDEEDRAIRDLHTMLTKVQKTLMVYNPTMGLLPADTLIKDWENRTHQESKTAKDINEALVHIYKEDVRNAQAFYAILDPDRYLKDPQITRRFLNLAHQLRSNDKIVKVVIFIGAKLTIPAALSSYIEVVHDKGLTDEGILAELDKVKSKVQVNPTPTLIRSFQGLTTFQIDAAISQSIVATKKDPDNPKRIDLRNIGEYRQRQLQKTDLVQYIDVTNYSFDDVGGLDRLKAWVEDEKSSWTDEGRKFGLKPPKGVLLLGVWGCGKSLSAKAIGNAWKLPVIGMEMGKLRNSLVGETEGNIYRALSAIESVGPCVLWIDEGEKSLSGSGSSNVSDSGTTARALGILSTWLQESKSPVCMVITANKLDTLPVEFVRRVDERFFFDLPSAEERVEILRIHLRKLGQHPEKYNLAQLAEDANQMVSDEIEKSLYAALKASFNANKECLDETILSQALKRRPRLVKAMADELKVVTDWVGYDPDTEDGIRARLASSRTKKAKLTVTTTAD
jgi:SpoVK/Ycf46/Vps4 family AAA+-type ATPase